MSGDADLGFGGGFEPTPQRPPSAPRGETRSFAKPLLIAGAVVLLVVFVFVLAKLFSGAGKQLAQQNSDMLSQVDHAKDTDAQVAAQNVLQAAKSIFASDASYAGVTPAAMAAAEPTYRYTSGVSSSVAVASIASTSTSVGIAVSSGKTCWYIADSENTGTTYASGTSACTGANAIRLATAHAW